MKKRINSIQLILIIGIAVLVGFFIGVNKINFDWKNYHPVLNIVNKEPPPGIITVDFNPFWNVWDKLITNYYDKSKLDQQKMLNGAISGLVQSIGDPFTIYLPPVANTDFKQGLAGQFSGIGAELGTSGKNIIVIAPLDGSPAQKMGIKAGDTIINVNGQSVVGTDISQVVTKIRGPKGTTVTLTIQHKGVSSSQDVTITRDVITVKSVTGLVKYANCKNGSCSIVDSKSKGNTEFAYIRLSQFGDNTNADWAVVSKNISSQLQSDKSIKGVVLDLRNNPGGYLTDAQFIAGEFLPMGTSVVVEDDGNGNTKTLNVDRNGSLLTPKLIILINKGSASASEIVSGAMRDNKRAELVGETSYGKGTIQAAEDLGDGAGLHVTIAKWLTPNGTWVNGKGLTPDVSVALDPKDPSRDTQLERAIAELLR